MGQSIDQALIDEFSAQVHEEAQQKTARLKPYANVIQMSGDRKFYDGLGSVEARESNERFGSATFDDIEHNRRLIKRTRYVVNLPIDSSDVRGALQDTTGQYSTAVVNAMMRQYDREIAKAAFADVFTGRDGSTIVTATVDGVKTVDATAGLTYEKLLEIHQNFTDYEVGTEMDEKLFFALTGKEHTALMGEVELTSGDYTRQFAVEGGKISNAAGFEIVKFGGSVANPILAVNAGTRDCIAASSKGIVLGVSKEITLKVQERDDLIETTQVQAIIEIGAVRTEGFQVQKVQTTA